jgi:septation ring formation regulator EzrA
MSDPMDMATPVTRGELRAEIRTAVEQRETKLEDKFEKFEDKFEKFEDKFEKLEARLEDKFEKLEAKLEKRFAQLATKAELEIWGRGMLEELARHTRAIQESMSGQISVIDDKYKDLPGRVNHLEAAVFGPVRR